MGFNIFEQNFKTTYNKGNKRIFSPEVFLGVR